MSNLVSSTELAFSVHFWEEWGILEILPLSCAVRTFHILPCANGVLVERGAHPAS